MAVPQVVDADPLHARLEASTVHLMVEEALRVGEDPLSLGEVRVLEPRADLLYEKVGQDVVR